MSTKAKSTFNNVFETIGALVPDFTQPQIGYLGASSSWTSMGAGVVKGTGTRGMRDAFQGIPKETRQPVSYPFAKINNEKKLIIEKLNEELEAEKQIIDWAKDHYTSWQARLPSEDSKIISGFSHGQKFINDFLRGKPVKELTAEEKKVVSRISKILASAPQLNEDIYVFRGSSKSILGSMGELPVKDLIGKTLYDKGYISTSLIPKQANNFAKDVFTIIKVPEGTKGAYIGHLSTLLDEHEFLLDKGLRIVVKDAFEKGHRIILDTEVRR